MDAKPFIVVGENIHCTRSVKRRGNRMGTADNGQEAVRFQYNGEQRLLPIPANWSDVSPDYTKGKVKHVALAVHHSLHGTNAEQKVGRDYLRAMADRQITAGAMYLDVNVDEYSTNVIVGAETMAWLSRFLAAYTDIPLSIDSSNPDILVAGLRATSGSSRRPMVNSVSLERLHVVDMIAEHDADAIVSAAGPTNLPTTAEERINNFCTIIDHLDSRNIPRERLHLDPLVLPISTDQTNGMHFLDAVRQARAAFDGVHINGGLSNISFGMPNRKLLNLVFIYLCVEAGVDGGIMDPIVTPIDAISTLNPDSESFAIARALLTGNDPFGMEYIAAFRDGRLTTDHA